MLDLFGRQYVIDHAVSELNSKRKEEIFKTYVTDALVFIAKAQGMEISPRYADVMKSLTAKPEQRTSEEIISDIQTKLGAL